MFYMQVIKSLQKTSERNNLVVVRAGKNSFHNKWLSDSPVTRNWDLLVSWYEPIPDWENQEAEGVVFHIGNKLQPLKFYWEKGWFDGYDYIWFPDPDIEINGQDISLLFSMMRLFDLDLAQPSLTRDSHISHEITLQVPGSILRYTTFVEVMQPCFSKRALEICAPTFDINRLTWGIDFVWSKLLNYPNKKIAILDAVCSSHTRPVGSSYDIQEAFREMYITLSKYEVNVRMDVLGAVLG